MWCISKNHLACNCPDYYRSSCLGRLCNAMFVAGPNAECDKQNHPPHRPPPTPRPARPARHTHMVPDSSSYQTLTHGQ